MLACTLLSPGIGKFHFSIPADRDNRESPKEIDIPDCHPHLSMDDLGNKYDAVFDTVPTNMCLIAVNLIHARKQYIHCKEILNNMTA